VTTSARTADTTVAATPSADTSRRGYTLADVRFMQHMIAHHGQALAMVALVPSRTSRDDIRLLAERIDVSQKTEIAMMQRWLRERGETVPDSNAAPTHSMAGHDMAAMPMASAAAPGSTEMPMGVAMPGMLTSSQMAALQKASGSTFDELFLQGMIQHHEGALTMVAALFASRGAGQEPEIFRFASDVDADQRAEIARMRALLGSSAASTHRPR
jgi:uncharacterized protein (DUF305 family)